MLVTGTTVAIVVAGLVAAIMMTLNMEDVRAAVEDAQKVVRMAEESGAFGATYRSKHAESYAEALETLRHSYARLLMDRTWQSFNLCRGCSKAIQDMFSLFNVMTVLALVLVVSTALGNIVGTADAMAGIYGRVFSRRRTRSQRRHNSARRTPTDGTDDGDPDGDNT